MQENLSDFADCCLATENASEIAVHVEQIMAILGFKAFIFSYTNETSEVAMSGNFDRQHLRLITSDKAYMTDPIMRGACESWGPIFWEASDYHCCGRPFSHMFELSLEVGYERGIAARIAGPFGQQAVLVAVYSGERHQMAEQRGALANAISVVGPYAAQAYCRAGGVTRDQEGRSLTIREIECLNWCARGKTAWETGCILARSERTVNFHLQNAMRKLEVVSKQQAMLKAIKLGLVAA